MTLINDNKWNDLERDVQDALRPIIDKHQDNFGSDSYAVIGAIEEVFDAMFPKINQRG